MRHEAIKIVATAVIGSLCLLTCPVVLNAPIPQTPSATGQTPGPVQRLLSVVASTSKLRRGMTGDRVDAFLVLTERNGDIIAATDRVKRARLDQQAVSALMNVIRGKRASKKLNDELVCANAAFALGVLGAKAKGAVSLLKDLEQHEDRFVAGEASDALKKIQAH